MLKYASRKDFLKKKHQHEKPSHQVKVMFALFHT